MWIMGEIESEIVSCRVAVCVYDTRKSHIETLKKYIH
jgi:hypothetical protein